MALRICILAEASPFLWIPHYIRAFRSRAEVITVGPTPDDKALKSWKLLDQKALITPNDITIDLDKIDSLLDILPEDWTPDLVVAIASNSVAAFHNTATLSCPSVFLSIDTWQCLQDYEHAKYYDHTFVAQREFVPHLQDVGAPNVTWLPLAADPQVHKPIPTPIDADLTLVGSTNALVHSQRAALLNALKEKFTVHVEQAAYGDQYCRAYTRATLAFNKSGVNELNMRVFEALAIGRLLLTDKLPEVAGLQDLFEDGKHLITYTDEADLLEKTVYYLKHDEERETIAQAGRQEILDRHTYQQRVDTILETIQISCPTFRQSTTPTSQPPTPPTTNPLPKTTKSLADLGLTLSASKYQLRNQGINRFVAIQFEADKKDARHPRYNEIVTYPEKPSTPVDTIIIKEIETLPHEPTELLHYAWNAIAPGGTLIIEINKQALKSLRLTPDQASLSGWLRSQDFHLIHGRISESGRCILRARKRTLPLKNILTELAKKYPIEGTAYPPGYIENLPDNL